MIEIKNLKKNFGSLEVLKGVNLKIDDGEVVTVEKGIGRGVGGDIGGREIWSGLGEL